MTVLVLCKSVMVIKLDVEVHFSFSFCFVLKMQKSNKQKYPMKKVRQRLMTSNQKINYRFLPLEAICNLFSTKMQVALHVNQNKLACFISSFASGVASNGRPPTKQGQNRRIHHCFVEKYQAMKQAHGKCTALHLYKAFLHLNSASQRPFIQSHSPARPIWRSQCPCLDISTCGTSLYYDDTVSSWVTTLLQCLFHSMTCSQINRSNVQLVTDVRSL